MAGLHMGGCQQDSAAGRPSLASGVGGLDEWEAIGFPWWFLLGCGAVGAFQHPEHTSGPQLGSRRGSQMSAGSCTGGNCSQLGSDDTT